MTTSTDKTEIKKKKAKGPIRTEAVVPVAIVFLLAFLYFKFFFDSNMRRLVEWTGSYVHGAEVNLASFETKFLAGSLVMRDLEVTDKAKPAQNLVQIGEIRFAFLWDALLRAKFVVNDSGIDGIQIYSPRRRPGYVKPPEPPSSDPSALARLEQNVLDQTQKDYSNNVLGDIAALLEGTDDKDVLKNIQAQLKSEATIQALQEDLKVKEKAWKERIETFPKKDEFEALAQRAKALKFDSKDPKQFAADVKEAGRISKEADAKIDEIRNTSRSLKTDVEKFNTEFRQLDDIVKQDIADIESRLKIPNLDLQDFSKNIFGRMFSEKLVAVQKYMEVGRKYLPPPKDPNAPKEKELIPPARGKGKSYNFPITTSYPLFWLKRASISSEPTSAGFAGKVAGELTNVTTSPAVVGKPAILNLNGDFPKTDVYGAALKLTIDHVREPKETLELKVGRYGLADFSLANDANFGLGIKKANGAADFIAQLKNQELAIDMKNQFSAIDYDIQAKSKTVQEAVTTILQGIPVVTLNAGAIGTWGQFSTHLNSNLGRELSAGLKRYVQAKVDEAKKKVRALVDARISGEKEKLRAEYDKLRAQIDSLIDGKKAELEKAKDGVTQDTKAKSSQQKDNLKKDLKERGKKLLKGFKF